MSPFYTQIGTAGASIGKSEQNTVSIPSDSMLAPLNHAVVKYERASRCCRRGEAGGSGSLDEVASSSEGGLSTPGKEEEEAGGFFFSDGGQETDFAAALRVRVGEGNRDWPLAQVRVMLLGGLTVFVRRGNELWVFPPGVDLLSDPPRTRDYCLRRR